MKDTVIVKTKRDIAMAVSADLGIDMLDATKATESVISAMKFFLGRGNEVSIRNLAQFRHVKRKKKIARDITRGTEVVLPEKLVIKVRIAKSLQDMADKAHSSKKN